VKLCTGAVFCILGLAAGAAAQTSAGNNFDAGGWWNGDNHALQYQQPDCARRESLLPRSRGDR
jgi:hypothetical protein